MNELLKFTNRGEFRTWLQHNCQSDEGIWLLFSKSKELITIKADEALEEALCYGWIDGQMQSIDELSYKKYFSLRRKNSKWSQKNKGLVEMLEKQGRMSDYGRAKIAEAKQNGQWDVSRPQAITEEQILSLTIVLQAYEPAFTNFQSMSPSVQKTYTKAYFDAKTEAGRTNRLSWMVDRLNKNLKPM